jgi:hypothetical protein
MSPKTDRTTRIDFADFPLRFTPAFDADPIYTHLFLTHQKLA